MCNHSSQSSPSGHREGGLHQYIVIAINEYIITGEKQPACLQDSEPTSLTTICHYVVSCFAGFKLDLDGVQCGPVEVTNYQMQKIH